MKTRGWNQSHANRELSRDANNDIALYAGEFSHHFLAGSFMSLFHTERSVELAEPGLFDLETEPSRLELRRTTAAQWLHFSTALINDELQARRYVAEQEYEFVLVLDVSRSLTADWREACRNSALWRTHTCYTLKYLAYSLLASAIHEGFTCRVILLDQGVTWEQRARDDDSFPFAILEHIDEHLDERPDPPPQEWLWEPVLRELLESPEQLLVAVISDFLDPIQEHVDEEMFMGLLGELGLRKRLIALQVNERWDPGHALGGDGVSLYDLRHGEVVGTKRHLGTKAVIRERSRYRDWLTAGEDGGRLADTLASYRIPHQWFMPGDSVNLRLEQLSYLVLQQ